ncbi:MAG TPA: flagellin [Candidatus Baltobacteraceae bacterium]|nr:flagellin [Candidatus Baltobacteraceae bacterium]
MASITSLTSNQSINSLEQTQQSQLTTFQQLSSGKRLTSAAVDPAGYAIATSLATQAAAASTASDNIQEAFNATNVAQGALQQLTGVLQTVQNLAVQGADSFLSPADRADLQAESNQLVQQANTIAQSVNFNGLPLLNGSLAGPQAGTAAVANVTNNDIVQNGGTVVTQVAAANANFQAPPAGAAQGFGGTSTTNSTIQVQVVNNNGQAAAVATVLDNATGQQATSAPVGAGGTISGFENVNITVGNISLADVGQTATIQIAQATPANTQNSALTVQSGANEGAITNVAIPGVNSTTLQINNINLSSALSSTQAIGQITNALNSLTTAQATLGAQQASLQNAAQADDVYANNLTTSQSNIADENVYQGAAQSSLQQIQQQIQLALQAKNNVNAAAVLGLFG